MTKKVAIVQSNYIPWKGYFDLIDGVDEFILYDDMQYTRRDWRNRNKIKTGSGLSWLTIAVKVKGQYYQKINETLVDDPNWTIDHWNKIKNAYRNAPYFAQTKEMVKSWYLEAAKFSRLSDINHMFILRICDFLEITTKISWSSDFDLVDGKSERLAQLCADAGGQVYVSGPAAKDYMDMPVFADKGLAIQWKEYTGYQQYPQLFEGFEHGVTILDVIFNCGDNARYFALPNEAAAR